MRAFLTASLAAAAIGLFSVSLSAAPAALAANGNATPFVHLVQYGGGGGGGDDSYHHHHCRAYWHWACHYGECRCYRD